MENLHACRCMGEEQRDLNRLTSKHQHLRSLESSNTLLFTSTATHVNPECAEYLAVSLLDGNPMTGELGFAVDFIGRSPTVGTWSPKPSMQVQILFARQQSIRLWSPSLRCRRVSGAALNPWLLSPTKILGVEEHLVFKRQPVPQVTAR